MAVSPDLAFWGSKMQVAGLQAWRLPISESRREPLTQTVGWHAWGLAGHRSHGLEARPG